MERLRVFLLMAVMSVLLVWLGDYLGGLSGAIVFFGLSLVMNFGMYWFSDRIVLRQYRAHIIEPGEEGGRFDALYRMVDGLRERAGLPMPVVAISEQAQPNAFATGRNAEHAVVCVTRGMWQLVESGQLSLEELEGVIGHELAHVKDRHMLVGTIAASMAGAVMLISRSLMFFGGQRDRNVNPIAMLLLIVLAPLAAMIIRSLISQSNEYEADADGSRISGKPLALAGALEKMEQIADRHPMDVSPAAAHLAIVNPLAGVGGLTSLFQTHPPTAERIARLREIAAREHTGR